MDDGILRERYRALLRQRLPGDGVSLETIEALAEGRLQGPARIAALDQVLADPAARREYEFLKDLAGNRLRAVRPPAWFAAAAAILLTAGVGVVWRAASSAGSDPVRGPDAAVVLALPVSGGLLRPGDTLVWRRSVGAERYLVEVVTTDGEIAFSAETADTTIAFAPPAAGADTAHAAQWWVTAMLGGSMRQRSAPRPVTIGR